MSYYCVLSCSCYSWLVNKQLALAKDFFAPVVCFLQKLPLLRSNAMPFECWKAFLIEFDRKENFMNPLNFIKSGLRPFRSAATIACIMAAASLVSLTSTAQANTEVEWAKENFKGEQDAIIKCETGSMAECNFLAQQYLERKEFQHRWSCCFKDLYSCSNLVHWQHLQPQRLCSWYSDCWLLMWKGWRLRLLTLI